jgi:hypothetical protein
MHAYIHTYIQESIVMSEDEEEAHTYIHACMHTYIHTYIQESMVMSEDEEEAHTYIHTYIRI